MLLVFLGIEHMEKVLTDNVSKIMKLFHNFLTTPYILAQIKSATKFIILWKVIITSFKINICFYLYIFLKKCEDDKYGNQNVHSINVTL